MAYQIRYTNSVMIRETRVERKSKLKWILGFSATLLVLGALQFEPVQNFLIPGESEVTKAAFSSFTRELKNGEPFREAAAVFCRQIIESDDIE